jgi:hypothetical protein
MEFDTLDKMNTQNNYYLHVIVQKLIKFFFIIIIIYPVKKLFWQF